VIEPLRLSFEIACGAEHAFQTWTSRTSAWWPRSATMSGEPEVEVIFEPRVGGRVFERTRDGREIEWGAITTWDPPRRIGYLWHLATGRADATEVEIVFVELARSSTRVEIEHHGWERLGAKGRRWREANQGGWDGVLPSYIAACATA
jgi:hypothetical protein